MTRFADSAKASSFADFDLSSFYIGAAALSAAAHCAELPVDLGALMRTNLGQGTFPTTRDLRRFSDLVSAATVGTNGGC
jgi:hypothetical protein